MLATAVVITVVAISPLASQTGTQSGGQPKAGVPQNAPWKSEFESGLKNWRENGGQWMVGADAALDKENPKLLKMLPGSGVAVNGTTGKTKHLVSKEEFGDVHLKIEFMVAQGANSGLYMQGRYEVQILDSWGKSKLSFADCGAIYQRWDRTRKPEGFEGHAPRINASLPPGEWQSFEVIFRAPRFDAAGQKITNALFEKVVYNGQLVQENVEVTGPTRSAMFRDEKPLGPLMLQGDHGPVAFRNILITSLPVADNAGKAEFTAPAASSSGDAHLDWSSTSPLRYSFLKSES